MSSLFPKKYERWSLGLALKMKFLETSLNSRLDPIVTETRSLREQYANQFGHNADAIFQDILLRQSASGKKLVSFQHRAPVLSQAGSQEERPVSNLPV